jgi:hypothetical protein
MLSRVSVSLVYHALINIVCRYITTTLAKWLSFPTRRSIGFRSACTQVSCTELSRGPKTSRPIISSSAGRVQV